MRFSTRSRRCFGVVVVTCLACCSTRTIATTRSWDDGGADKSWQTPANWTDDTRPAAGDDVTIGDLLVAAGDEVTLSAFVNVGSLTMFNECKVSTGQYELLVQGGPLELLSTLGGAWVAAEDRDPSQPARTTLLDSVDADSMRIDNDSLLQLVDGVVEIDQGELYLAPSGFLFGTGRIDLGRTDAGRNLNNNGVILSSETLGEILIQNDTQITGADGTVDLDGNVGVGRWWAGGGDITITAPLSDREFNGRMIIESGNHLTIADDWQLGDDGQILFEHGGVVLGGNLEVFGSAVINSSAGGSGQFRDLHMTISGGTPDFSAEGDATLDLGAGGEVTFSAAGARFHGDGTLKPGRTNVVDAPTRIGDAGTNTLAFDFDAGSWVLNADLELNVAVIDDSDAQYNGSVVVNDATLMVNIPWEAGAGARIELDGGELVGFSLDLADDNAFLTGHGQVAAAVVNDGLIRADGGVLRLAHVGSDWDGAANAGRLNAFSGDLHLVNALPFVFRGVGAAFAGNELFVDGAPFHFGATSTLWLNDGTFRSPTYNSLDGELLIYGAVSSFIDTALFRFESHALVTLDANLILTGTTAEIVSGATFSGGGVLVNDKYSRLTLLDGANVQVAIENHGTLNLGASPGQAQGLSFKQGTAGDLEIELGGASLSDYDRIVLNGTAQLAGRLSVSLWAGFNPAIGQAFSILSAAGGRFGMFDEIVLPAMDPGELMLVHYGAKGVTLRVVELLAGDFDEDGDVDGADLARWESGFGLGAGAAHAQGDANGDGAVAGDDFLIWQRQYGMAVVVPPVTGVPEAGTILLAMIAAVLIALLHGRGRLISRR
ncbi:MAG: hypothetical protein KDA44_15790 [Planctomycetales bacterium]|nr:hypothetical protein [Planctomycetales bacterium]